MDTGVPSVTTPGTIMMQAWCADSSDTLVILFLSLILGW